MRRYKKASDIKTGVVGYGGAFNMGPHHFREMQRAGMTPVAVADMDPSRLEAAQEDFPGIQTFTSLKAMLKGSDVNLIAMITPHNTHASVRKPRINPHAFDHIGYYFNPSNAFFAMVASLDFGNFRTTSFKNRRALALSPNC